MTTTIPSQGTHFSDGLRTGPIIGSTFVAGANVLTPSTQTSSPLDQQPPGVFNTPMSLLDIIPTPVAIASLAAAQTPVGAGYLTLVSTSGIGATVMTYQSVTGVIKLDVPRTILIQGVANTVTADITVFGWDQYGMPIAEQITGPTAATQAIGKKAFLYVRAVYASGGTTDTISIGVSNVFGLPYYVSDVNYLGIPEWNGLPETNPETATLLGNNLLTSTNASSVISITVADSTAYVVGQQISITGAATFRGITANQLNITAKVVALFDATHITYTSLGTATSSGAGGGATVTITYPTSVGTGLAGTAVVGDPRTATATTGDVRGTYTPTSLADGHKRLTINFYNASADTRNYIAAANGSVILNNNPLTTTNASTAITVFAPNHQYTNGETVTISGGTGTIATVTAGQYNISATVTVLSADRFSYTTAGTANAAADGGATLVTMTPRFGNLYQTGAGRFGVSQYTVALF